VERENSPDVGIRVLLDQADQIRGAASVKPVASVPEQVDDAACLQRPRLLTLNEALSLELSECSVGDSVEVGPLVLDFQLSRKENLLPVLPKKRGQVSDGIFLTRVGRSLLPGPFEIKVVVFRQIPPALSAALLSPRSNALRTLTIQS
jgi:hypothetical protein